MTDLSKTTSTSEESSENSSKKQTPIKLNRNFKLLKLQINSDVQSSSINQSEINLLQEELYKTMSILDTYYDNSKNKSEDIKNFSQILNLFDPFRSFKYKISQSYHGQNVSSSWIKFWEIISEFKLIPISLNNESFITFDNASLPGNIILVVNHYIKTLTNIKSHVWYACSNISDKINDPFKLIANYSTRWIMNKNVNGDITNLENITYIKSNLQESIHLYTSDLTLDTPKNYNNQELEHAKSNLGQILLGIYLLKKGGNFIVKMYTFFTDFSQSLILYCSGQFENFYIVKPMTSKITNIECYLVGIGFKGINDDISILETRLKTFNTDYIIPVKNKDIFNNSLKILYEPLISSLKQSIVLYNDISGDFEEYYKKLKNDLKTQYTTITSKWLQSYPIKSLRQKDKINCTETLSSSSKIIYS